MMVKLHLQHVVVVVGYIVGNRLATGFIFRTKSISNLQNQRLFNRKRLHSTVPSDNAAEADEDVENNDQEDWLETYTEVVKDGHGDGNELRIKEEDWVPDRDKAKMIKDLKRRQSVVKSKQLGKSSYKGSVFERMNDRQRLKNELKEAKKKKKKRVVVSSNDKNAPIKPHKYSDEQEALIKAMGGRKDSPSKRQSGFLGDSTLQEIATDFGTPVVYLADVLCTWGVPPPINVKERLGDMVTGEQAFAMVEALHSLDMAVLQDRYSTTSFVEICDLEGIDLRKGFEMCMKEGWSLPFGVRSFLRKEQEEELIRALADTDGFEGDDEEEFDYGDIDQYRDAAP